MSLPKTGVDECFEAVQMLCVVSMPDGAPTRVRVAELLNVAGPIAIGLGTLNIRATASLPSKGRHEIRLMSVHDRTVAVQVRVLP